MSTSQAQAAAFLIDNFNIPTTPPANTPLIFNTVGQTATQNFTGLDKNQVIGGSRQLTYTLTNSGDPSPRSEAEVITGTGGFDGFLNIENRVRTTSKAELMYSDLNTMGQGNFNMLSGANNKKGIVIDQVSDGIPFTYTLIVSDGGMNMSSVTKSFDFEGDETKTQALFSFDEILGGCGMMGCDGLLSNVNFVKLIVEGNSGYDLAINQIGTYEVPEPSSILGLLAVFGVGAFSIKRSTKEKS